MNAVAVEGAEGNNPVAGRPLDSILDCSLRVIENACASGVDAVYFGDDRGRQAGFYGGISTQRLLPFGTVGQVRDEVRRLVDKVGEGGGCIASPAHAVPPDARPENVAAMIEALQDQ